MGVLEGEKAAGLSVVLVRTWMARNLAKWWARQVSLLVRWVVV